MRPLVLAILDGWGYSPQELGNAVKSANTPNINFIRKNYPMLLLQASGKSVGLEWGEPGNSEVGHLTIGAGRTVFQYSTRINRAIESGDFEKNPALLNAISHVQKNNSALHLIGLLGSGTVHASLVHLFALINLSAQKGIKNLKLHLFADGKDSGLKEAPELIKKVQDHLTQTGTGSIASIIGRHYAMDRDNNWEQTREAYDLIARGKGEKTDNLSAQLRTYYDKGFTDTDIPATLADEQGIMKDDDALIFFNFREDSMRQIARSFVERDFDKFPRVDASNLFIVLMTQYLEDPHGSLNVAFPLPDVDNGLAQVLSEQGKKQLHIAETIKYAHTTYFFNCLRNVPYEGEIDILIDSHKDHIAHPEMKADVIVQRFLEELSKDLYDFTVMNFANADILSHAGNLEMATRGVEFIDAAIGSIYKAVLEKDGVLIITADHGNAESLIYKRSGEAETKHNLNPVPFHLIAREYARELSEQDIRQETESTRGIISDIAPTILELMQIPIPVEMTGANLLTLIS